MIAFWFFGTPDIFWWKFCFKWVLNGKDPRNRSREGLLKLTANES